MKTLILLAALVAVPALAADIPLDLAGLPRATASYAAHGKTHGCEGVALTALLARAGVPAGEALRGPALTQLVIARGKDGYRVAFSLGELDASLGNRSVLVADRCDGAALAAEDGPLRLVVPGEARAARSVRQLVGLAVVPAAE